MNKQVWEELKEFIESKIIESKHFGGSMKAYHDLCAIKNKMSELEKRF